MQKKKKKARPKTIINRMNRKLETQNAKRKKNIIIIKIEQLYKFLFHSV